ncbi:MAG: 16S rRNA (cytosine(967)-C(5))-methyltransferase RsmB [candidate division KSB1 bacterium]|nr:16S rRNA (cytosine(967)-C(5))-methyltransferase RsmB [candidate division KSB1 bacterium]MDZ7273020.1 16S rRNA (cytosine(967)-C(5))-methyltransferase RsmB [candidate division KSB1 bacterium]MDZ7285123.1 16S rRNA (cytosine(967)-C(5))-methyltransferase RsmB [candidate division KSB1 bacterium]MDZ7298155.1 16S rRNA (cytosine(967)-C(5))-methyltransferase RsmB [candidate division KSB1 bacterium]MDZ7306909.1 16S rRNA (cytosine(967)-C(5))-methyltransferase RsmB [candidate division KSB1 bacterium]
MTDLSTAATPAAPARPTAARRLACRILTEAETGSAYLDQVLEKHLGRSRLPEPDKALVTAIANGVTRWRRRLDAELARHFQKNFAGARPLLKNILRSALFQLRYFDRVPSYAVVHEAVELTRAHFGEPLARLCNAVLRNALRAPMRWPDPEILLQANDLGQLAQALSYPEWLLQRWRERHGDAGMLALAQANNEIPKLTIRVVQPARHTQAVLAELAAAGASLQEIAGLPHFYQMPPLHHLANLETFKAGAFVVQDGSAGLVAHLAAPARGGMIVDLCAAPGGKALHLAELAPQARVIAVDQSPKRLRLLAEAAQRVHCKIDMIAADARTFSGVAADLVLVDAPCSGLGVLAKRSDLRWRRRPEDIPALVQLQQEILRNAATLVTPGGRLIYSTCTTEPAENEEMVAWFLATHPAFVLQPAQQFVDDRFCDPQGFVRTLPHRHGLDGSFAAHLLKLS